jgi:hypothetical protein
VTYSTGQFNNKGFTIWTTSGLGSTAVKTTASNTTDPVTISVTAGYVMFAAAMNNGTFSFTWASSSVVPNGFYNLEASAAGDSMADWAILATNASFSVNSTSAGGANSIVAATWG